MRYWIEVDFNGMPLGGICFAYFPDDKPIEGTWILVEEVKI
jgi:hypothetical protein